MNIKVQKLTKMEFQSMGINDWPIWEKEESVFNWYYDEKEQFYLIEGNAKIKTEGTEVEVNPGDFVICPKGLECEWNVKSYIKKHYHFFEE